MAKKKKIKCGVCGKGSYKYKDTVEDESVAICDKCIEYSSKDIEQRSEEKNVTENETITHHLQMEIDRLPLDEKRVLLKELRDKAFEDNRANTRIPYEVKVHYTIQKDFGHDYIHDISHSGLFLETFEEYPIGEECLLSIPLSNQEQNVKVRGRVARVADNGVGIEFTKKIT